MGDLEGEKANFIFWKGFAMRKIHYFIEMGRVILILMNSSFWMIYGIWRLSRLRQPIIGVFGGKGAYEGGKYATWARDFSYKIAKLGASVITGGGEGIMEAANCGARDGSDGAKNATLGITVKGLDEDFSNPCAPVIKVNQFFVRKWLLIHYSRAFVLFPGGVGTVDEFFEVINLSQIANLEAPIYLVGEKYWNDLIAWYHNAFQHQLISKELQHAFIITDNIDEIVNQLKNDCSKGLNSWF